MPKRYAGELLSYADEEWVWAVTTSLNGAHVTRHLFAAFEVQTKAIEQAPPIHQS